MRSLELGFSGKTKYTHDDKNKVKISLTADPSDEAIYMMLDASKPFNSLTMNPCDHALVALKIFEAAKLRKMPITLAPADEDLINQDIRLKGYFKKIKGLSDEEFIKMKGGTPLGEIPPERPSPKLKAK